MPGLGSIVCVSLLKFCLGSGFLLKGRERMVARVALGCGTEFAVADTIAWSQPWERPATSCIDFKPFVAFVCSQPQNWVIISFPLGFVFFGCASLICFLSGLAFVRRQLFNSLQLLLLIFFPISTQS